MAGRNRNRRKGSRGEGHGLLILAITGAVGTLMLLGIVHLWMGWVCESINARIRRLEAERRALVQTYDNRFYEWARLKSPPNVEAYLEHYDLPMRWPPRDCVVPLSIPPAPADEQQAWEAEVVRVARLEPAGIAE